MKRLVNYFYFYMLPKILFEGGSIFPTLENGLYLKAGCMRGKVLFKNSQGVCCEKIPFAVTRHAELF